MFFSGRRVIRGNLACDTILQVLAYAERCGNVAKTCRHFGISRQCYYNWLHAHERFGEAGLISRGRWWREATRGDRGGLTASRPRVLRLNCRERPARRVSSLLATPGPLAQLPSPDPIGVGRHQRISPHERGDGRSTCVVCPP